MIHFPPVPAIPTLLLCPPPTLVSPLQWVPFCELSYLRTDSRAPAGGRLERTAIYLVDAWALASRSAEAEAALAGAAGAASAEARAKQDLEEGQARLAELEAAAKAAAEAAGSARPGEPTADGLDPPTMNVQQLQVRGRWDCQGGLAAACLLTARAGGHSRFLCTDMIASALHTLEPA